MKKIILFILLFVSFQLSGQGDNSSFSLLITNQNESLTYYLIANTPTAVAHSDDPSVDFTFTVQWPTAAGLTLGSFQPLIVNTPLGGTSPLITIAGAVTDGPTGYKRQGYQVGNVNGVLLPTMTLNQPVLIGQHPFTATDHSALVATILPSGILFGQPNITIETDDFYNYIPIVLGQALSTRLLSFSVNKLNVSSTFINWVTSSETNTSHFSIERSLNGYRWESIGRVSAAGTSRVEKAYHYFDDKLPRFTSSSQEVYYRLKMYDRDGRFQYSEIRSVLFEKEEGFIHIYPNPATQKTYIDLSGIEHNGEDLELTVIDMNGSLVMRKTFKATDLEPVQIDQLPANTYQIMVKHGDQVYQQRLVKVD